MEKGYNISVFEKGSLIIRCCAAYMPASITEYDDGDSVIESRRQVVASIVHNDFRTEPVRLLAVENGVIYLESVNTTILALANMGASSPTYRMIHEYWQDGWMPFEKPEGLTNNQCY